MNHKNSTDLLLTTLELDKYCLSNSQPSLSSLPLCTSNSHVDEFKQRLTEYKKCIINEKNGKHTFTIDALNLEINESLLDDWCKRCEEVRGDVDFDMIILIRLLYLLNNKALDSATTETQTESIRITQYCTRIIKKIEISLSQFPFWPKRKSGSDILNNNTYVNEICFWSENHIFMLLGSAHLLKQWIENRNESCIFHSSNIPDITITNTTTDIPITCLVTSFEECMLKTYLDAHITFQGVYECNSHVYLPYTLSALLNIIDFSNDNTIKTMATSLANIIIRQLLLCTTANNGVVNLSATCRGFSRTRQRNHYHNVNQLIKLFTDKQQSPDAFQPMQLTNFLLTTSYLPPEEIFALIDFNGFTCVQINHPRGNIRELYKSSRDKYALPTVITDDELIPFYWSAGLIVHPEFAKETLQYQISRYLTRNNHLKPLAWAGSTWLTERLLKSYSHFSAGQSYTGDRGVVLNVYKRSSHGLLMSSFDRFIGGISGFQQFPWVVNLCGVGLWSQSGKGSEGIGGWGITNTHNPHVTQRGAVLIAAYVKPSILKTAIVGNLFSGHSQLFWPEAFLDMSVKVTNAAVVGGDGGSSSEDPMKKDWLDGAWWVGQRGSCFIGVTCTHETELVCTPVKDAELEATVGETYKGGKAHAQRRVCKASCHAWIVLVGTTEEYSDLSVFVDKCKSMKVFHRRASGSGMMEAMLFPSPDSKPPSYEVTVTDPNGELETVSINCCSE